MFHATLILICHLSTSVAPTKKVSRERKFNCTTLAGHRNTVIALLPPTPSLRTKSQARHLSNPCMYTYRSISNCSGRTYVVGSRSYQQTHDMETTDRKDCGGRCRASGRDTLFRVCIATPSPACRFSIGSSRCSQRSPL